ncbi:hypothetical protein SAMN03159335_06239 [Burkholderia cepacia]|uniref:hypothetical protein n=1 Tax=Burkholderia cepacia TaxID=292 RepID=UPI0008D74DD8|nr:hypothetical protein [Burkholderia cepacia]SEU40224.1 hypothetical protein SAMN03159335_06239 [Burkholderia cepacia]
MSRSIEAHFKLRKPCENCPFLKKGAIELAPGRLDGIIGTLVEDDHSTFQCHKTVHGPQGGEWDDEGKYHASGNESMCAGAMIYLEKLGRPTVAMRLGRVFGVYNPDRLRTAFADVIDPANRSRIGQK